VVLDHTRQRQRPRVQVGEQLLLGHGRSTRANVGCSDFTESAAQNRQPPGPSRSLQRRLSSLAIDWFWGMGDIPHLSPPLAAAVAGDPPKSSRRGRRGNQGRIELEHQLRLRLAKPMAGAPPESSRCKRRGNSRRVELHRLAGPSPLAPPRWPRLRSLAYEQIEVLRVDF
jgi:hypothetical protein